MSATSEKVIRILPSSKYTPCKSIFCPLHSNRVGVVSFLAFSLKVREHNELGRKGPVKSANIWNAKNYNVGIPGAAETAEADAKVDRLAFGLEEPPNMSLSGSYTWLNQRTRKVKVQPNRSLALVLRCLKRGNKSRQLPQSGDRRWWRFSLGFCRWFLKAFRR